MLQRGSEYLILNFYFLFILKFLNKNDTKNTMGGFIGNSKTTWQPWNYKDMLKMAQKVEKFKKTLQYPSVKQRGKVSAFIAINK